MYVDYMNKANFNKIYIIFSIHYVKDVMLALSLLCMIFGQFESEKRPTAFV